MVNYAGMEPFVAWKRPHVRISRGLKIHSVGEEYLPLRALFPNPAAEVEHWFANWIAARLATARDAFEAVLRDENSEEVSLASKVQLIVAIGQTVRKHPQLTIQDIIARVDQLNQASGHAQTSADVIASLVFCVIGWLTMLYDPVSMIHGTKFQIVAKIPLDPSQYLRYDRPYSDVKRKLPHFLKGFGMLLPDKCLDAVNSVKLDAHVPSISPDRFNADLLTAVGKLKIEWIETLPSHLFLDVEKSTLYLYRYPSFCLANLSVNPADSTSEQNGLSILRSCCTDSNELHWMQEWELDDYLSEVLLSYRLLFGQQKASRECFRKLRKRHEAISTWDPLLVRLCENKTWAIGSEDLDRETYNLVSTFPVLKNKLVRLKTYLDERKPKGWRELWHDRRNSGDWMTFWTVLIFGALSVTLSTLNFVVAILQLWRQW